MVQKKDNFITISNSDIWQMLERLTESVGHLSNVVEGIGHTIKNMELKITEYEGNFRKYDRLENKVIGGWVVLTLLGVGLIFMGRVYLKTVITDIVEEEVIQHQIR